MLPVALLGDVAGVAPILIIGPGAPTVLVMGRPIACLGDVVGAGQVLVGTLAMPCAVTVLACGRPVAHMATLAVPSNLPVVATGVTVLVPS